MSLVSGYEVLCELGRGTTGVVYKARHCGHGLTVALKLPDLSIEAERPARLARFRCEAEALAGLTSRRDANIPAIHEVGEFAGGPYFLPFLVREYVDGNTLEQRIASRTLG